MSESFLAATRRLRRPNDALIRAMLCRTIDRYPATRGLGIVFSVDGTNTVYRDPEDGQDGYLVIEAVRGRTPPPISSLKNGVWRRAVAVGEMPRLVPAPEPAPAPPPEPHHASAGDERPDTTHDVINLVADVAIFGLGVAAIVVTGGAAAPIEAAVIAQTAVSGVVAANDAVRVGSDVAGGHISQEEDASSVYHIVSTAVFAYQIIGPGGAVEGVKDVAAADTALGDAKLGWREALSGDIGPGQRVKLGYALELGGRSARIAAIRSALALKLANQIGGVMLSLGLSAWGGPLYDVGSSLHFALISLTPRHSQEQGTP